MPRLIAPSFNFALPTVSTDLKPIHKWKDGRTKNFALYNSVAGLSGLQQAGIPVVLSLRKN